MTYVPAAIKIGELADSSMYPNLENCCEKSDLYSSDKKRSVKHQVEDKKKNNWFKYDYHYAERSKLYNPFVKKSAHQHSAEDSESTE